MNIFYTTVAVALQAVAIPAFWGAYNLNQVLCMRSAAIIISGLYCFELIFRFDMRLPLVAHHFFTVFAICFAVTYVASPAYLPRLDLSLSCGVKLMR